MKASEQAKETAAEEVESPYTHGELIPVPFWKLLRVLLRREHLFVIASYQVRNGIPRINIEIK
jgi:hypothetical protein